MLWSVFAQANPFDLWQPIILAVSVTLQVLYLLAVIGPWKRHFRFYEPVQRRKIVSFISSMWVMYLSFAGPLDYLSDNYLFSVHMIQHVLEIVVMTPLFIKGIPDWMFHPVMQWKPTRALFRAWAYPLAAGGIFNVVYTAFHYPYLYNLALLSDPFHLFEHCVFFVTAFFMWIPSISPYTDLPRLTPGKRLLYILYNYNLMMPIVVLLLVARHPWYSFYVSAPRIIPWLTPMADMQVAAIIMAAGSAIAYIIVGLRTYAVQNEHVWYS